MGRSELDVLIKLIEIGQQLTEGEGTGKVFGFETSRWWVYTYPIIWSYGGMVTNEDHTESKMTMEQTIAAFQFHADFDQQIQNCAIASRKRLKASTLCSAADAWPSAPFGIRGCSR